MYIPTHPCKAYKSIHLMASRASIRIATHHTFNNKWMLSFDGTVKVLYVNQEEEFEWYVRWSSPWMLITVIFVNPFTNRAVLEQN